MKRFGRKNPAELALLALGNGIEKMGQFVEPITQLFAPLWAGLSLVSFSYIWYYWPGGIYRDLLLWTVGVTVLITMSQSLVLWRLSREQSRLKQELVRQSSHDAITGALSAQRLMEETDREIRLAHRKNISLGAIGLRIDNLLDINNRFGREEGDRLLYAVALACQGELRETDFFGRLNGLVFCALLPETASSQEEAGVVLERLKSAVSQIRRSHELGEIIPQASFALVNYENADTATLLLGKAEAALR